MVIKISAALVFIEAVLVGVGAELSKIVFSYAAMCLAGVALLAMLVSALPLRRRASRFP